MSKGQSSAEFLILLAIGLVILIIVIAVAFEQMRDVGRIKAEGDARNSVQDLAAAANEVCSQGAGARKQVFVIIPPDYDMQASRVANKTILLRARGTDFAASSDFEVSGTLPQAEGGNWVWITCEGSSARIGDVHLQLSANSIRASMLNNSVKQETFIVRNIGNSSMNVTIAKSWSASEVSLVLSSESFALNAGYNQTITLTFTSSIDAVGTYSGELTATGVYSGGSESLTLPVSVEVSSVGGGGGGGAVGQCNVSYMSIATFKDAGYSQESSSFTRPDIATITGESYTLGGTATVNIFLNSSGPGSPVSGYPKTEAINSSGGFMHQWNPVGATAGAYNVSASDGSKSASYLFTVTSCS